MSAFSALFYPCLAVLKRVIIYLQSSVLNNNSNHCLSTLTFITMSQVSLSEQPHFQQVDLTQLNLQQLTQLKQQLDQELVVFQDSLHSLKIAQTKFQESNESLDKFTPESKGKEILVPLTGSMYVPGKLADTEKVLIDVGTGYYAEVTIPHAKEYFKRRIAYVTEQMEKIQVIGQEKNRIREATMDVMEMKLQSLQKEVAQQSQVS